MTLTVGAKLGPYEILAPLGSGGMGEVYRARDTGLKRDVAIKVLPEAFARDADRLLRFQREAELLATLNHPNIAAVYGLEQTDGVTAIVLELVEGETLAETVARHRSSRGLGVSDAITIAGQIAEALEAAHEKGVIHRDLKPANIKVTPDGTVKVLDFGLGKMLDPDVAAPSSRSMSPTLSVHATHAGVILGTAAYMSPEQAKGRPVDRRTDIFSFGCVLYEMLAGQPAFVGESATEILARIIEREPAWGRLPATVPPRVHELLRLCLEKDPKKRRRDAADVRIDLERALNEPPAVTVRASPFARGARVVWLALLILAAVLTVGLAIPAMRHLRETSPPEMRVQINTPSTRLPMHFAISPDGRYIALVASGDGPQRLWLRALDQTDAQPISGTDGAQFPFWSADSRSIGFFASGKLYRVDIGGGGSPRALADAPLGRGGTWNADGTIVFVPTVTGAILRMPASGGDPVALPFAPLASGFPRFPQFLPDGRHFLFFLIGTREITGVYLGSLDGGQPKLLTAADASGAFLKPDMIVFVRQGALVARRLDLSRWELTGDPVTVADPIGYDLGFLLGGFSISGDGFVAYRPISAAGRQLTWMDRNGKALAVAGDADTNHPGSPELSPDGRRLAFRRIVQITTDVWLMDLDRSSLTRFTFDPHQARGVGTGRNFLPIWSPDDVARIAFASDRDGVVNLYVKSSTGTAAEELLLKTPNEKAPQDWSHDGRSLLYVENDPKTGYDLWALEMNGTDRKRRAVVNTAFDERNGQFSPDGRFVAYETNEAGRFEIMLQRFPEPTRKWQVSTSGGTQPRWRPDGKELYYIAPDSKLMAVPVALTASAAEVGTPAALFSTRIVANGTANFFKHEYAVSRDGRFLINQPSDQSTTAPIMLIVNWRSRPGK